MKAITGFLGALIVLGVSLFAGAGEEKPPEQPKKEKPWQLSIRLPREMEPIIRKLAKQRVVPPAVICRQLIKERLDQLEAESQREDR